MKQRSTFFAAVTVAVAILFSISVFVAAQTATSAQSPAQYKPSPDVKNKAASPQPGSTARQQSKQGTIGDDDADDDDDVMIKTGHENNIFWVEDIDLDGTGVKTASEMLWDDTNKVLYVYADDKALTCTNGKKADGDLMIATYGTGNKAKKPAGSGWWMADFDLGECDVRKEGTFGCKFNAQGENTACGLVDVDKRTNELTIIEAFRTAQ
jgi:hypothetical protein